MSWTFNQIDIMAFYFLVNDIRSKRYDAAWVNLFVTAIIMMLNMVKIDRFSDFRVEHHTSHKAMQVRVVLDASFIALKMVVINRVKTN